MHRLYTNSPLSFNFEKLKYIWNVLQCACIQFVSNLACVAKTSISAIDIY